MEFEPSHLKQLSRDITSTLGSHLGEFRKAATDSNKNIGSVVKDISKMFSSQKKDQSELHETLDETSQATQRTATKVDQTNNILQETLALQNSILAELKHMNSAMNFMNTNMQNNNAPSLISSILDSKFGTVLKGLGAVGLAVGGGMVASNLYDESQEKKRQNSDILAGLGGNGEVKGKGTANFQTVAPKLMADLQKDFPGMSKEDAAAIIGNLSEESGGFTKMKEGGGGPGRGWAQWTSPDRKAKFLQNVAKYGNGDLENYQANYETLKNELKNEYAGVLKQMMATQGVGNKSRLFMEKFENPNRALAHMDVRLNETQRALNLSNTGSAVAQDASAESKPEPMSQGGSGGAGGGTSPGMPDANPNPSRHGGIISGAMGEGKENKDDGSGLTTLKTNSGKTFQVASAYADRFKGFVDELESSGYKINSIGGFADRNIAGTNTKSWHSKGMAIDINPSENPVTYRGQPGAGKTNLPQNVGEMAAKYGLGWGGNWKNKLDTMHFSFGPNEGGDGDGSTNIGEKESDKLKTGGGGTGAGKSDATPQSQAPATPSMAQTSAQDTGGAPPSTGAEAPAYDINKDSKAMAFAQGLGGGGMGGMAGGMMGGGMPGLGGLGMGMGMGMPTGMSGMLSGVGAGLGGMSGGGGMGLIGPLIGQLAGLGMGGGGMGGLPMGGMAQLMGGRDKQSSMNMAQLNSAEIEKQLNDSNTKQALIQHFNNQNKQSDEQAVYQGNSGQFTVNDYNGPEDIGWPDWAMRLGYSGSHYRELDKIKLF